MKHKLFVSIIILLVTILPGAAFAQTINVVAPKLVAAPVAFADATYGTAPSVYFSSDGRYLLAHTGREAKAWRMPEGELVYRFNTSMMKDDKTRGVLNYAVTGIEITADGKFIYTRGGSGQDFIMIPAYLETGELLEDGLVKDSIKNGLYQFRRGLKNIGEASIRVMNEFYGSTSPLLIKRSKDGNFDEKLGILGLTASADYPGEIIVCYRQTFCGSRSFINEHLTKSVKEVREQQFSSNRCQFYDVHASRFNPATNTAVYLGNLLKGFGGVDFRETIKVVPSPLGDVIYVTADAMKTGVAFHSFNSPDGKVLWDPSKKLQGNFSFMSFDDFGNVVFRTFNGRAVTSEVQLDALTGEVLHQYIFSAPLLQNVYNAQWNLNVAVSKTTSGDYGISMYDAVSGEHRLSVNDAEGAAAITAKTTAEINRFNAYVAANQKAMQDSWDLQIAENARYAQAAREKKIVDDAAHATAYKPCPLCSGTGVWVNSGVAKAYRKTSYSEGRALDGSRTTIKSTESSTGGYWEQRGPCLKCHGRGEVRRN